MIQAKTPMLYSYLKIFTMSVMVTVSLCPILLAFPSATLTYVMAKEMNGDPDFAVGVISGCTLMSGITFSFWLHFLL